MKESTDNVDCQSSLRFCKEHLVRMGDGRVVPNRIDGVDNRAKPIQNTHYVFILWPKMLKGWMLGAKALEKRGNGCAFHICNASLSTQGAEIPVKRRV